MTNENSPRFFVGIVEIGDYTLRLSQGLRELGFPVTNVVETPASSLFEREIRHDRYIPVKKHKMLRYSRRVPELLRHVQDHDVFVFNFSHTFLSPLVHLRQGWLRALAGLDLWLLKRLGKQIVVIVNGDDLRSRPRLIEQARADGLDDHVRYLAQVNLMLQYEGAKRRLAALLEEYADHIFARPISAQFLTRDYHLVWVPIDLNTVEFSLELRAEPLVLHAPSQRGIKGTKFVLEAVEQLQEEGHPFRFELCENMSNIELRKRLTRSEIVVDQLILPGYGLFAVEAMASGNAVLGSAVPGYNGYGDDLPVLTTTPDTIYGNLKRVLIDRDYRTQLALQGREYVETYHDYRAVTRDFVTKIGMGHHLFGL